MWLLLRFYSGGIIMCLNWLKLKVYWGKLGRGIDVFIVKPWIEKTSLQLGEGGNNQSKAGKLIAFHPFCVWLNPRSWLGSTFPLNITMPLCSASSWNAIFGFPPALYCRPWNSYWSTTEFEKYEFSKQISSTGECLWRVDPKEKNLPVRLTEQHCCRAVRQWSK